MSNRRISVDQLASTINEYLSEYTEDLSLATKDAATKVGKDTAKQLKGSSPKRIGGYSKGWRFKVVSESADKIEGVVHNAKWYMLTHLLEHGHAKRGGGRVAARVNIAPAEQYANEKFQEEVEKAAGKV